MHVIGHINGRKSFEKIDLCLVYFFTSHKPGIWTGVCGAVYSYPLLVLLEMFERSCSICVISSDEIHIWCDPRISDRLLNHPPFAPQPLSTSQERQLDSVLHSLSRAILKYGEKTREFFSPHSYSRQIFTHYELSVRLTLQMAALKVYLILFFPSPPLAGPQGGDSPHDPHSALMCTLQDSRR